MGYFIFIFLMVAIAKPLHGLIEIQAIKSLPVLGLGLGILKFAFYKKRHIVISRLHNYSEILIYLSFILCFLVSILRNIYNSDGEDVTLISLVNESLQLILLSTFIYIFVGYLFRFSEDFRSTISQIIFTVITGPGIFIMMNTILFVMGVQRDVSEDFGEVTESVIGSLLGLDMGRGGFIFTGHPNSFAVVVGGIVVMSTLTLMYIRISYWQRLLLLVILLVSIFAVILADSRGTMGAIVFSIGLVIALSRLRLLSISKIIVLIIPFIPFVISSILKIMAGTSIGAAVSRGDNDLATGNSRMIIWKYVVEEMMDPDLIHIIGWGQVGHVHSKVNMGWIREINYDTYTHNLTYQVFLDMGYLGLFLLVGLLYISIKNCVFLYQKGNKELLIFIAFILYYPLSGIFEGGLGVYNHFYSMTYIALIPCPILIKNAYINRQLT